MNQAPNTPRSDAFVRVLSGLLKPLVRALIAQGVTAPALYRQIKKTYVEVAEEDFSIEGKPATDSRINVLTGVHRRDVRQFREEADGKDVTTRTRVTTIVSVIGKWLADRNYTDKDGNPLPLKRFGTDINTFESLVISVSRDVRPRTVLDELMRQGLVSLDEETELLTLNPEAFLGPADLDQKVHFFADNVGDHLAAAVDNLLSEKPRYMERAVFYNRLTQSSIDEIEERARTIGNDALLELNKTAHSKQQNDMSTEDGTQRFRFGVFFYHEDQATKKNTDETSERDDDA